MDVWPLIFNYEPSLELVIVPWMTMQEFNVQNMREARESIKKQHRAAEQRALLKKNRNNSRYTTTYHGATYKSEPEAVVTDWDDWEPLVTVEFGGANYVLTPAQMKYLQDHGVTGFRYP